MSEHGSLVWAPRIAVPALMVLVVVIALANLGMDGEVLAWQVNTLGNVNNVEGSSMLVNGVMVRGEGLANIQNANHLAGGSASMNFYYELAIGRFLVPFLASIMTLALPDAVVATKVLNVLCWVAAVLCAYSFVRDEFKDERLAFVVGATLAGAIGFIATLLGTKGHLPSFAWFTALFALASRLRLPDRTGSWRAYGVLALAMALAAFMNNVWVAFGIVFVVVGVARRAPIAPLALVLGAPLVASTCLRIVVKFSYPGVPDSDRTLGHIIGEFLKHVLAGARTLVSSEPFTYSIVDTGGRTMTFDGFLGPFRWFDQFLGNFALLCGPFILVLAVGALMSPLARSVRWGAGIAAAVGLVVFGVQTYWPTHTFWAYATYTAFLGFHLLAAQGLLNAADGAAWVGERLQSKPANRLSALVIAVGLGAIIAFGNQHLFSGRLIEVERFHVRSNIEFPSDWPFEVTRW